MPTPEDYAKARANLWAKQKDLDCFPKCVVTINDEFKFSMEHETGWIEETPELRCYLKPEMLRRILRREFHWNNAEIGCHIFFDRRPNDYMPDVHTLMSFFHL